MKQVGFCVIKYFNNKKHYFKYETMGALNPKSLKPERMASGFFSPYKEDAKIYSLHELAELIASGYEGAEVEYIESEENEHV